ncbi:MAG: MaoC/PaaZ C-terminal domain-containing protein [Candidatus Nanopelagicales bacterium]|nr:MaoC/PaaZ C-terminal domain-containing protein [Candidatus Nanopelagicales bacterium]MDZ4248700.1 MaoC/PaaZ C-terminal domain-containing protein [Candidatus Nanopelagicales bacterium]
MSAIISYDDVEVGTELPKLEVRLQRVNLVMYAGASGDFNPIHWNTRYANQVGLPDVIAHGMLTMATAARLVTEWVADPGAVVSYSVRFSKPVVVPDDDRGAVLSVAGRVLEKLPDRRVRVGLEVTSPGDGGPVDVMHKATIVAQLA